MSKRIDLVYDADCPHKELARANIKVSLSNYAGEIDLHEWSSSDPKCPPHVLGFGSPTILIDKREITGMLSVAGMRGCRIYRTSNGQEHAPSVNQIRDALL